MLSIGTSSSLKGTVLIATLIWTCPRPYRATAVLVNTDICWRFDSQSQLKSPPPPLLCPSSFTRTMNQKRRRGEAASSSSDSPIKPCQTSSVRTPSPVRRRVRTPLTASRHEDTASIAPLPDFDSSLVPTIVLPSLSSGLKLTAKRMAVFYKYVGRRCYFTTSDCEMLTRKQCDTLCFLRQLYTSSPLTLPDGSSKASIKQYNAQEHALRAYRELYHNRLFDNSHIHIIGTMLGEPRANHTVSYLLGNYSKAIRQEQIRSLQCLDRTCSDYAGALRRQSDVVSENIYHAPTLMSCGQCAHRGHRYRLAQFSLHVLIDRHVLLPDCFAMSTMQLSSSRELQICFDAVTKELSRYCANVRGVVLDSSAGTARPADVVSHFRLSCGNDPLRCVEQMNEWIDAMH